MEQTSSIFIQLASILGLSSLVGFFIKNLRLPLLVAYLLVGVLLSFLNLFDVNHTQALKLLPEIGIAIVLFLVGMELNLKELKFLGKPIVISCLIQVIISIIAGYSIASFLGFSNVVSFYLGVGLSFSSTIVVVKLLLEKNDLASLYGKLSLGILLIEDLVAIILLMVMTIGSSALNTGLQNNLPLFALLAKGILFLLSTVILSKYLLPKIFRGVASSPELLFLSALSLCFIFVSVSLLVGFSVVIGAFLAGVALANSPFHYEIQGKIKPLRDFFVTLFFVYLGAQVIFSQVYEVLPMITIFVLYALVVKPIIFLLILGAFGFKKHTIFQTSLNLSNISEFSLIILLVGAQQGIVPQTALTSMALTGVISIIASSIMISQSKKIYLYSKPFISFFERKDFSHQTEGTLVNPIEDHVVLIGAHRIGSEVVSFLKRQGVPFLVLDFNPKVVSDLVSAKIHALYGDIGDPEILEFLNLNNSKLIISTANSLEDNLILLSEVKRRKVGAYVVARAASVLDAKKLYKAGADYVILPETISGDFITQVLKSHWPSLNFFMDRSRIELEKLNNKSIQN